MAESLVTLSFPFHKKVKIMCFTCFIIFNGDGSHLAKAIAHAKAIPFAKWSVWVTNYKWVTKHTTNHSASTLELFCAKNRSKKYQIFEK